MAMLLWVDTVERGILSAPRRNLIQETSSSRNTESNKVRLLDSFVVHSALAAD
jgi:hypothetical protein